MAEKEPNKAAAAAALLLPTILSVVDLFSPVGERGKVKTNRRSVNNTEEEAGRE